MSASSNFFTTGGESPAHLDNRVREILGQLPIDFAGSIYLNFGVAGAMGHEAYAGTVQSSGAAQISSTVKEFDSSIKPAFNSVYDVEDWFFTRSGDRALDEQMHVLVVAIFSRSSTRFIEIVKRRLKEMILEEYREPSDKKEDKDNRPIKPIDTPFKGGQRRLYHNTATRVEFVPYFESGVVQQVETIVFEQDRYREAILNFLRTSVDLAELRQKLDTILLTLCVEEDNEKLVTEWGVAQPSLTRNQAALAVGELAKGDYGYYRRKYIEPLIDFANSTKREGKNEEAIYIAIGWILYGIAKDANYRQMVVQQIDTWLADDDLSLILAACYASIPLSFLSDGGIDWALKIIEKALALEHNFSDKNLSQEEMLALIAHINLRELLVKKSPRIAHEVEKLLENIKIGDMAALLSNDDFSILLDGLFDDKDIQANVTRAIHERVVTLMQQRLRLHLALILRTLFTASATNAIKVLYMLAKWLRLPANTEPKKARRQWAMAFFLSYINGDSKFVNDYQDLSHQAKSIEHAASQTQHTQENPPQHHEANIAAPYTADEGRHLETPPAAEASPQPTVEHAVSLGMTRKTQNPKPSDSTLAQLTLWQVVWQALEKSNSTIEQDLFDLVQACLSAPQALYRDAVYRVLESWLEEGDKDRRVRPFIYRQLYALYSSPKGYLYVHRLVNSRKYISSSLARKLREDAPNKP